MTARLVAGLVGMVLLAACQRETPPLVVERASGETAVAFLARHWARPLPPQGPAPAGWLALESSLDPAVCGQCHPAQLADWAGSHHARAASPGLLGQLGELGVDGMINDCFGCHAPLAEQAAALRQSGAAARPAGTAKADPPADAAAAAGRFGAEVRHGLSCAGCHVRQHRRFGPPPRSGVVAPPQSPHGGFTVATAYEDSRFCAACHQFEPDAFRINGKLLEDTYEEWAASRYAREGRACQSCHMPDRRHLWRGIHDPAMVRAGVTVTTEPPVVAGDGVQAALTLASVGVGHRFPTYVTPRVTVRMVQRDAAGRDLPATAQVAEIGWGVPLDLASEWFDTRLAPDETRRFAYAQRRHPRAVEVDFQVRIDPDEFYARFYRAMLADPSFQTGRAEISQALAAAEASPYDLYRTQLALPPR